MTQTYSGGRSDGTDGAHEEALREIPPGNAHEVTSLAAL